VSDAGPGDPLSDDAAVTIGITKAVADGQVTIDDNGVVRIGGTSGNNHIMVTRTLFGSKLQVRIDGELVSGDTPLSEVQEVRAWGREGNDKITVLLVNVPALLHGGEGNDQIVGGLSSNLIFGGLGTDKLVGGVRADLLVGGDANDTLLDAFGDDVLVGGNVSNQLTDDFFRHVLEQWNNDHSPNDRFAAALSDDGAADAMFDSLGDDWFAVGFDDSAVDFNPFDDDLITAL
jgi:Ca2+-binding RTX toxin-like protein